MKSNPLRTSIVQEWPVVLLKWTDKQSDGRASKLEVVDEFRTFVKPTWRPQLSKFCTSLTGITQVLVYILINLYMWLTVTYRTKWISRLHSLR